MPKVSFVNEKRDIEVPQGGNLREEAIKAGIPVNFQFGSAKAGKYLNCLGFGSCGSCHVLVKKGAENLSPKGTWEKLRMGLMMATIGHEDESRLACQTRVNGDCSVVTNPGNESGTARTSGRSRIQTSEWLVVSGIAAAWTTHHDHHSQWLRYDFPGKVVLVTGSSRGMGAAILEAFAKAGPTCVVNYFADPDGQNRRDAEETAGRLRAHQVPVHVLRG